MMTFLALTQAVLLVFEKTRYRVLNLVFDNADLSIIYNTSHHRLYLTLAANRIGNLSSPYSGCFASDRRGRFYCESNKN